MSFSLFQWLYIDVSFFNENHSRIYPKRKKKPSRCIKNQSKTPKQGAMTACSLLAPLSFPL
ncbi:MAG: hypothetical protein Q8807_03220 ['Waltheria sp.' little leaf phytoplasma]|nr:hypothetical protein ['Waltheria sp.' little leaf phytoplasma]